MRVKETLAKSIIVASKLPDADYVVNPYTGCEFGCSYCYASFMGRFVSEPIENWGNYLYAKTNSVELFAKELKAWPPARRKSSILLSSVTDPYQGAEKRYRLVRGILEVLAEEAYPGPVSILTKSPLVLRDIDLLHKIPDAEVGLTITTTDDEVSRVLEVRAPSATKRIETLKKLNEQGIKTYAFVGPLLPHFRFRPDLLEDLFKSLALSGVKEIYVEHMNMSPYIRKRHIQMLQERSPELVDQYLAADTESHREALEQMVAGLVEQFGFKLLLGEVLLHKKQD